MHLKEKTATWVLDQMKPFLKSHGKILEVGCAFGYFLKTAESAGYGAAGLEISEAYEEARQKGLQVFPSTLENFERPEGSFDAVVMVDVFEHLSDPESTLKKCRTLLDKKSGILTMIVPDFGSISRKLLGSYWLHYKKEHLFYYSKKSLIKLLRKHGFEPLVLKTAKKATNFSYIAAHSARYHNLPRVFNRLLGKLPFSTTPFLVNSELFCIARVSQGVQ
jgi:2-polyprenyl-3-methyl-5-hydroxy-6-metoxy-1,4-benzoquinol methylase